MSISLRTADKDTLCTGCNKAVKAGDALIGTSPESYKHVWCFPMYTIANVETVDGMKTLSSANQNLCRICHVTSRATAKYHKSALIPSKIYPLCEDGKMEAEIVLHCQTCSAPLVATKAIVKEGTIRTTITGCQCCSHCGNVCCTACRKDEDAKTYCRECYKLISELQLRKRVRKHSTASTQ